MRFEGLNLPPDLYTANQVRELDRRAIEDHGIPGIVLMKRAGRATFEYLRALWPEATTISIWCGAGNNGGDGYIVAGLAKQSGYNVQLVQVGEPLDEAGDASLACQWAKNQGITFEQFDEHIRIRGDVILDALLGTGLQGEVRGRVAQAIAEINQADQPILAVDIASGLCSDRGVVLGVAVRADSTISFIGLKRGLFTADGPGCSGNIAFSSLSVPSDVLNGLAVNTQRANFEAFKGVFGPRSKTAHKGDFGHVLVVGGYLGMGGAVLMAAEAACRVGAGRVSVATHPNHVAAVLARCPEIMAHPVNSGQDLEALVDQASVVVVGPGLGISAWSEQLLRVVLATQKPLVVDADALNLIANGATSQQHRGNWILTPHPGEAARLLGQGVAEVQADRFQAVHGLQEKYEGVTLLKGPGTLVCSGKQTTFLCCDGNPGMAAGGMGDVLSGVIGGLLAQGFDLFDATVVGACLHGAAADRAAKFGERGMVATDLMPELRTLVNNGSEQHSQGSNRD